MLKIVSKKAGQTAVVAESMQNKERLFWRMWGMKIHQECTKTILNASTRVVLEEKEED